MQKLYFLALLLIGAATSLSAQNGIVGTGFSTGWNVPADNTDFMASAGDSRILTTTANGMGDQFFRLVRNAGDDEFYQNGQFGPVGCTADANVSATEGAVNATAGCGDVAFFINVDDATDNYVFKTRGLFVDPVDFIYFKIEGPVKEIPAGIFTAQAPMPDANGDIAENQTVTVGTLVNGGFSPGQAPYLRYTTDGFASSVVLAMDDVGGGFYTATIPGQPNGTTVTYYLFTSGDAVAPAADGSDADYRTINLLNNGGANYVYNINRALPVTYAAFTGRRIKTNSVQLNWATATEDQASHFTLQCSDDDGRNWMDRALISAANLLTGAAYAYLDEGAPYGDLQYRLKQTDFDGSFTHSAIITVAAGDASLEVWPQPAGDVLNLRIPAGQATTSVQLLDLTGRVKRNITLTEGRQTIDVADLKPGVYLLRGEGMETKRIIVR